MQTIGMTKTGFTVKAIPPGIESPMANHKGGEIAVDNTARIMYAWSVFVACYGTESIMSACNRY